ncbi:MAG: hypothetical protein K0Q66_1305 [Chitinophagaceae bacterium]|nr:hypothetical protein [Chitinophagaceae bacterium]
MSQETKTDTLWIESTPVEIRQSNYGTNAGDIVFLNVHENESTSVKAAEQYLEGKEGKLLRVHQSGKRFLSFRLKTTTFQFDPNRIFSEKGREATLKGNNKTYLPVVEKKVEEFAEQLLSNISDAKVIVALHNNTDGGPLTIKTFPVKHRYVNPAMDADDFVLTTEKSIFDQLKKKKINVVLETSANTVDDGSLSIYCSKKKIPYINIEAQQGHQSQQVKMMNALSDILKQYTN